jgi:hypothetical protein
VIRLLEAQRPPRIGPGTAFAQTPSGRGFEVGPYGRGRVAEQTRGPVLSQTGPVPHLYANRRWRPTRNIMLMPPHSVVHAERLILDCRPAYPQRGKRVPIGAAPSRGRINAGRGDASKPGVGADPMRWGGVGSFGTRGWVIDRDQLRKLDQTVIERRRRDRGRRLRAMNEAHQGGEDFHWRSPGAADLGPSEPD